jgi:hypothetical protein
VRRQRERVRVGHHVETVRTLGGQRRARVSRTSPGSSTPADGTPAAAAEAPVT